MRSRTEPVIPLSVPDLSPIVEGGDAAQALRNSLDLARHAERWATGACGSRSSKYSGEPSWACIYEYES